MDEHSFSVHNGFPPIKWSFSFGSEKQMPNSWRLVEKKIFSLGVTNTISHVTLRFFETYTMHCKLLLQKKPDRRDELLTLVTQEANTSPHRTPRGSSL